MTVSFLGRSINLNDGQSDYLNSLPPLYAIIHDANINEAVMTKVYHFKAQQFVRTSPAEDKVLLQKIAVNLDQSLPKKTPGMPEMSAALPVLSPPGGNGGRPVRREHPGQTAQRALPRRVPSRVPVME